MQKELNPELFGTGIVGQSRFRDNQRPNETTANSRLPSQQTMQLEEKIAEIRSQVKFAMDQMASLVAQVNEYIKSSHAQMNRMQSSIKTLENSEKTNFSELGQRLTHVHQRINERKTWDLKVQELIDRQNGVLKTYEVRMNHLQKLLHEKDAQLISSQAALNESKMEISRLKRL